MMIIIVFYQYKSIYTQLQKKHTYYMYMDLL